ncbi:hypothetical protein M758_4G031500 [Ceratodon purpureus]|nr:hypothetical protein M758_4G031500 [Ceratodon purpureus]
MDGGCISVGVGERGNWEVLEEHAGVGFLGGCVFGPEFELQLGLGVLFLELACGGLFREVWFLMLSFQLRRRGRGEAEEGVGALVRVVVPWLGFVMGVGGGLELSFCLRFEVV